MRVEIVLAKRGMPEQAEGPRNTGVDRREIGEGALHVFPPKSPPQFLPWATAF